MAVENLAGFFRENADRIKKTAEELRLFSAKISMLAKVGGFPLEKSDKANLSMLRFQCGKIIELIQNLKEEVENESN